MADLVKLKRQKNAYKTHLTGSINNLDSELAKDENARNIDLMKQLLQQVEIKYDKWEKSMMVLQDEDPDSDIDKSMNEIDGVLDSVIQLKVKTNSSIENVTKAEIKAEADVKSESPTKVKDRLNLPKLQMKKFNGVDIEMFQEWFQMFDATIHKSSLSTVEKFIYLKMSLTEGSEAAKLIDGYQVTEENYDAALKDLYEAYGDKEIVINYHVSKLLSLPTQSGPQSLKDLYNSVTTHVRSLDALGITAGQYSVFLVPIVKSKLSDELRKEITRKKIKKIDELLAELKEEVETESSSHQVKVAFGAEVKHESKPQPQRSRWSNPTYQSQPPVNTAQVLTTYSSNKYCVFCPGKQSHWVDECNKAKNMSPQQCKEFALKENACLGCFKKGHKYKNCMSRARMKCAKCQSPNHHTFLHESNRKGAAYVTITANNKSTVTEKVDEKPEVATEETVNQIVNSEKIDVKDVKGATALQVKLDKDATIMPIIRVRIKGNNDKKLEVNALLDQCSDQTFVRSDVVDYLELDGPTVPIEVRGITGITDGRNNRRMITTSLYNKDYSQEVKASLIEMPLICKPIKRPAVSTEVLNNRNLRNLNLADTYQNEESKEIHILIGLDFYYNCITGKIKRAKDQPVAIETLFGWMLVSDSLNQDLQQKPCGNTLCTMFISEEAERGINDDLRKFWELDEEIVSKPVKPENEMAIKKFHESVNYDKETKQYEVGLPYVESKDICSNYKKAEIILRSQMKRFEKNPTLKEKYYQAMSEHIEQGFAELVPHDEIYSSDPSIYYMPHSAVIKDENTTTKTRIVFNASSSAKNQLSLNEKLLKGPKRQPSISEILIRWRVKPVALVADIRKMYSMILVREEDRNALRFVWLDEDNNIVHYRHKVLPFGVRSAPYLAIETVQSHIMKFSEIYPDVTESLIDSTYVDDYCTAEENADTAIDTVTAADHIMEEAGMELRKWMSNDEAVMNHLRSSNSSTISEDEERKVLGAWWNAEADEFYYKVNPTIYKSSARITKRMIVASVPTLHDPIGFIAPVILKGKIMIQKLWAAAVEWDENLVGTNVANEWLEWRKELEQLKDIQLNRKYTPTEVTIKEQQVHVFCDASETGYAAVAYMRSEAEDGTIYTEFITSKTKVAPIKFVTLPRLELLSALIASRLSLKIRTALKDQYIKFQHWSDSSIALQWINNSETRWKTFVESRVDEIRDNTDPKSWRHVPGVQNPADIASRGALVTEVRDSTLWRGGPSWLKEAKEEWPKSVNVLTVNNQEAMKERRSKQVSCLLADTSISEPVISPDKYSSFNTLLRKTAYIMRFPRNCRLKKLNKPINDKGLTAEERSDAQKYWLKIVQQEYYPDEVSKLKAKEHIKQDSKIVQLSPYYDEEVGLIRMKGRIQHSNLTESEKHPIILPHQSPIVRLLVEYIHLKQMHSGISQTLVSLRDEFWVTSARSLVRSIVKSCIICRMYMPTRMTAPISPLPEDRVTETTPFDIIGVDFTGPVYVAETKQTIKHTKKRPVQMVKTKTTSKSYIALITCAVTRAVHLELVPDLTTDAFIRAFRRFTSRRGQCSVIYSDNAKTYKCAEKGITQCYEILNGEPFRQFLAEKSIKWKYICPLSPWWGGFWERLMKNIKLPLKKFLGKSFLTYDELSTILTEVEAMVNSRPLLPVNDDPDNLNYLTPANFLIGRPTINLPVRPLKHTEVNPNATRKELNRMLQYQEAKLNKIWKMWREEYLRSRGVGVNRKEKLPIKVGDLIMVASGQQPRCTWKLGIVEQLLEGRDERIRSAVVRTEEKSLTRPIQLMSKLEVSA